MMAAGEDMKLQPWARKSTSTPAPYDAFISYSHAVDSRLGPALRDALHQFARPWHRLRALRVFCDQRSLSASPGLWSTIEAALAASRYFILLASPESAGSPWVQREMQQWQRTKPKRPFLIVLTDGEIAWNRTAGDFDWNRTTALPKSLPGWSTEEPLWVDLRQARREEDLSLKNPAFLDAVATLAASLHGRAKDELIGEDVRHHQRATRFRRFSWAGLSILTMLAVLAATVAVIQRNEARVQTRRAIQERNRAEARRMVAQAEALRPVRPAVSALLTVAAWRMADIPDTRSALLNTQGYRRAGALLGHSGIVYGIAVSPDGALLASTGSDGSVRLWDLAERRRLPPLDSGGHGFSSSPMFSADGSVLATGAYDGTVRLWDLAARRPLARPIPVDSGPQRGRLVVMALSPGGSTLAVATQKGTVRLWNIATGRPIDEAFRGHTQRMRAMAFSPDDAILATADDTTVRLWDVASRRQLGDGVEAVVPPPPGGPALAFRPDGAVLAVADHNRRVRLVDVASHSIVGQPLQTSHQLRAVAFNPDGTILATAGRDGVVRLWDTATHRELDELLAGHSGNAWSVAFTPDGNTLTTSASEGRLLLWEMNGAILGRHAASVEAVAFNPDGTVLVSLGVDGSVRLWDVQKQRPVSARQKMPTLQVANIYQTTPDPTVRAVFSPDGRILAMSAAGGGVWLWDTTGPGPPTELTSTEFSVPPAMAFNPDGTILATTNVEKVRLWDVATRRTVGTMEADPGTISSLAFSADGRRLATGSFAVQMWDLTTRQRLGPPVVPPRRGHTKFINAVAISPDGTVLATGSADQTARLWRLPNGDPLWGSLDHGDEVIDVAFTTDVETLVTTSKDGTVRFWDTRQGSELWSISGLADQQSAAISPQPSRVATGDVDGRVVLWSTDVERVAAEICGLGGNPLTEQEWQTLLPELSHQQVCP